jgi:hypothetical protein
LVKRYRIALPFAAILGLSACAGSGQASSEPATYRGRLTVVQWPAVEIDGKPMRAAPGTRITSPNNLTITPNMVNPGSAVTYEIDSLGHVRNVRILPARE